MADAATNCKAGDADSSRAPGLTSGLHGPMNAHRGALLLCHSDSASVLLYFTLLTTCEQHFYSAYLRYDTTRSLCGVQRYVCIINCFLILYPCNA